MSNELLGERSFHFASPSPSRVVSNRPANRFHWLWLESCNTIGQRKFGVMLARKAIKSFDDRVDRFERQHP